MGTDLPNDDDPVSRPLARVKRSHNAEIKPGVRL
jgi:hypothetical protein